MNKLIKSSLLIAAIVPALALGQARMGENEVTLSGTGSSDQNFDWNSFNLQGSFGQYINDMGLAGIRQNLSIGVSGEAIGDDEDTVFDGATFVFYNHHFGTGAARPFVGANLGYIYGETTEETFSAGLEAGLKYYVLDKTFVQGLVQYQFLFEEAEDFDNQSDDGAFYYSVGMGYNF
jgi:hypothetical protein